MSSKPASVSAQREAARKGTPAAATGLAAAEASVDTDLLGDIQQLIIEARRTAAVAVNASLTPLYWRIGQRIRAEVLGRAGADYGQEILPTLSAELMPRYGRGFSARYVWLAVGRVKGRVLAPRPWWSTLARDPSTAAALGRELTSDLRPVAHPLVRFPRRTRSITSGRVSPSLTKPMPP